VEVAATCRAKRRRKGASVTTTMVLVHGAFTGAWEWEPVVERLRAQSIVATTVDLTTREQGGSLHADEELVRDVVSAAGGRVVLVGHSYAGAVITGASAGNAKVSDLVYVAAALPDEGQSVTASRGAPPTGAVPGELIAVDIDGTIQRLFNDASPEQVAWARPRLTPFVRHAMDELPSGLGWKEHRVAYVLCTQDVAIPLEVQQRFAERARERFTLDAGHSPMVTQPDELTAILAAIARRPDER